MGIFKCYNVIVAEINSYIGVQMNTHSSGFSYGGPTLQVVTSAFTIDWLTYISATAKVIVAQVDGRGTGGRGRFYEQSIYKNLGVIEIEDQLDSVKALIRRFHYINESQVGAYGWSYGGFTVSHLLTRPENQWIRCGISVAPVSDFRYYCKYEK
ncbi:uncharacterized protein DC041_0006373 [Schistosoma bovis]|uniref:Peptidase S9 prolyl oligopeptidase catalytic domain-containing protein n=1 Tax=Schistosoma bovis TaxID=6184 RepID=A0A430QIX2_SCHBO|nr:uncharacterized protein DC041_0006373 [Schistosoma bovis]